MTIADLPSIAFERPRDLAALTARLSELLAEEKKPVLLAGGTDFMVEQEMRKPFGAGEARPFVLDVSRLDELRFIELAGPVLRIGAATTYLEMRNDPIVNERAPLLARMARDVGAIQIQARGTLGGNLATASPAADGVAAIAAYDPVIVVRSVRGERRIPFPELQTGYKTTNRAADEVIVGLEIPLTRAGTPWYWRKVGTRRAQSISKVALGGVAELDGDQVVRVGLGMASVAPVTSLLGRVRALLLSTPLSRIDAETLDKAVRSDVTPIDDIRSTGRYRDHVACAVVRDFVETLRTHRP